MTQTTKLKRSLVDVAMGRAAADLVVQNGQWVCVQSGEIIPNTDIAIKNGHVAFVGPNARHAIGKTTKIIHARGRYLVPGLLDAHLHVESSMLTVTEFVRGVVPHGTTGIFFDPHEIANVFGLRGVKLMVDEASKQPIHAWVQMPSCVPSAPGLETPGSRIQVQDVVTAMDWPGIIGLGEMMNFPAVRDGDRKMLAEISAAQAAKKTIGGHYASPDLGLPFHGYVSGGAEDDHEGTRLEDAVARVRQGMKPMLRYGSAWQDVASQLGAIMQMGLESHRFILCTDDSHAQTLAVDGHMDRVIRHAIAQGLPPMKAIQMATTNTAEHFGLAREMGMIAPGRWADLVLVRDLNNFQADLVVAKGRVVAQGGKCKYVPPKFNYPSWARASVHLQRPLRAQDFLLRLGDANTRLKANVIVVIENQAPTRHIIVDIQADKGEVKADVTRDLSKVAVVKRHKGTSGINLGLVSGFGFTEKCAIASTVAHDCHHMIVVGTDEADMAMAGNELARIGGGQIVVKDGRIIGLVDLKIGGLMSKDRLEVVARKAETVLAGFRACGCRLNNPIIQLSFLALVVIPELRLSDKGLLKVGSRKFIPVLQEV